MPDELAPSAPLHEEEPTLDAALVRGLLADQAPELADLPLAPCPLLGTTNWIVRLGDGHAVRLPRVAYGQVAIEREDRWLPRLAPGLSLEVPRALFRGAPVRGYPFTWSVHRWIPGQPAGSVEGTTSTDLARELAAFVLELRALEVPIDAPTGGRGAPLADRDATLRRCLDQLGERVDRDAALELWERALATPVPDAEPVWVHGDLMPDNLLLRDGRLAAVIDFGSLDTGAPGCDLLPAWTLFDGAARAAYRDALGVDDAGWLRGRAQALAWAVIFLPYYEGKHPRGVALARRTLERVLARGAGTGAG